MENFTAFDIILQGEGAWPDLQEKGYLPGQIVGASVLEHGTSEGRPSVTFRIKLTDGTVILAQTTLRLFALAARAMTTRYPDDGSV